MAKALRGLGFAMEEIRDRNHDQMRRAFRAFGVQSRSAEIDGANSRIPVDASLADDETVDLELLRLATGALRGASALTILDSCRARTRPLAVRPSPYRQDLKESPVF